MSAWYVWSALGFFPETPGTADLAIGSPMFTNVTVTLGGGGTITVNAPAGRRQRAVRAEPATSTARRGTTPTCRRRSRPAAARSTSRSAPPRTPAGPSAASSAPPSYAGNGGAQPPIGGTRPDRADQVRHRRRRAWTCPTAAPPTAPRCRRGRCNRHQRADVDGARRRQPPGDRQVPGRQPERHRQRLDRAAVDVQRLRRAAVDVQRDQPQPGQPGVRPVPRRPGQRHTARSW